MGIEIRITSPLRGDRIREEANPGFRPPWRTAPWAILVLSLREGCGTTQDRSLSRDE
jgi:hypothetical protein